MTQTDLQSHETYGHLSGVVGRRLRPHLRRKIPRILRVVTAALVGCVSWGTARVAYAEETESPRWQLDLKAESVTPTSHFTGSARFFGPGRRHYNRRERASYHEYSPAPEGYVMQETSIRPLMWSGALLLGIPYAFGLTYAVVDDFPARTGFLAIPVVGPWLARTGEQDRATRVVLGLDGLTQAAGAVLLTLGLTLTRREWVPYTMGQVWVVPSATARGQVGLTAGGTF